MYPWVDTIPMCWAEDSEKEADMMSVGCASGR